MRVLGSNRWFKKARSGGMGQRAGSRKERLGGERTEPGGDHRVARDGTGNRALTGVDPFVRKGWNTPL